MGEVFRAHDDVLDRIVAVKVVAAGYHSDPGARPRFERERRLTASLDHPHICRLLDAGHENGLDYFVMEYLEGETLATRLQGGPLPFDAFLTYATQIADALAYAHARGVIHRDLKPANIYLTPQGAKLLDFGLAKLIEADHAEADQRQDTVPVATPATVLGTPCYLAPERLRGTAADERTDLYGFGLILFEMASGRRAFGGPTGPALFNAILSARRGALNLGPGYPASLERLIETCLAVDPAQRWGSAGEVAAAVRRLPERSARNPKVRVGRHAAWALGLAMVVAAAASLWVWWPPSPTAGSLTGFEVGPPPGTEFSLDPATVSTPQLAVSPDASRLVMVLRPAGTDDLQSKLWVRNLSSLSPAPLEGTDGARYPFWAPDGRWIAFFDKSRLKRIRLSDQKVEDLGEAPNGRGGTWNSDDTIVYAPDNNQNLYRIAAVGGEAKAVTMLDDTRLETSHRFPRFLPGGDEFVYLVRTRQLNADAIYRRSLSGGESTRVVNSTHGAVPFDKGLLVIQEEALYLKSLDSSTDGVGQLGLVARGVAASSAFYSAVSASRDGGVIAFAPLADRADLRWADRDGRTTDVELSDERFADFSLSPDRRQLAVSKIDPKTGRPDIVIKNLATGISQVLVSSPNTDASPVWLSMSKLAFRSNGSGIHDLYWKPVGAPVQPERPLIESLKLATFPTSVSRGGLLVFYVDTGPSRQKDIWALGADGKPYPLVESEFDEVQGQISPDGKWLAYTVKESSQTVVYLRAFDATGRGTQISKGRGSDPKWSPDGRELYYIAPKDNSGRGTLMAASMGWTTAVKGSPGTSPDITQIDFRPLFEIGIPAHPTSGAYEVAGDGRFLIREPRQNPRFEPLRVYKGWAPGSDPLQ